MKRKWLRITAAAVACLALLAAAGVLGINGWVKHRTAAQIVSPEAAREWEADCILVLGCLVHPNGRPSDMLADRLEQAVVVYDLGCAPKLLMSGDHGRETYNEVAAMKQYALDAGVPEADIFQDHAGFSTYESLYRAKEIFGAKRVIIVTQQYHLYRALYIAEALELEAVGVAADAHRYVGQTVRELREILARNKDVLQCLFLPQPTYLGDPIDLRGDGRITEGK